MSKFPPDGYTVEAEWDQKTETPMTTVAVNLPKEHLPREISKKFSEPLDAFDEAKHWIDLGYHVRVYQTINVLVLNRTSQ